MHGQVVIVPILKKNTDTEAVLAAADALAEAAKAAGLRAKVDAGTEKTPGFKFSYWEMKVRSPLTLFQLASSTLGGSQDRCLQSTITCMGIIICKSMPLGRRVEQGRMKCAGGAGAHRGGAA